MKLFDWLRTPRRDERSAALTEWRRNWTAAVESQDGDSERLRLQLRDLEAPHVDLEIELEMLDALEQLREAQRATASGRLPVVETHHRVIGGNACHFTAPASLPSDQNHASGRLLLTSARAVFVGGGRTAATAWHAVHDIARIDRDVLLVRADRSPAAHFRFNTYGDAVLCAFLAGRLRPAR